MHRATPVLPIRSERAVVNAAARMSAAALIREQPRRHVQPAGRRQIEVLRYDKSELDGGSSQSACFHRIRTGNPTVAELFRFESQALKAVNFESQALKAVN